MTLFFHSNYIFTILAEEYTISCWWARFQYRIVTNWLFASKFSIFFAFSYNKSINDLIFYYSTSNSIQNTQKSLVWPAKRQNTQDQVFESPKMRSICNKLNEWPIYFCWNFPCRYLTHIYKTRHTVLEQWIFDCEWTHMKRKNKTEKQSVTELIWI